MCHHHTLLWPCGRRRVEQHTLHIHVMDGVFMPNDFRVQSVPNTFLALNAVFSTHCACKLCFPCHNSVFGIANDCCWWCILIQRVGQWDGQGATCLLFLPAHQRAARQRLRRVFIFFCLRLGDAKANIGKAGSSPPGEVRLCVEMCAEVPQLGFGFWRL